MKKEYRDSVKKHLEENPGLNNSALADVIVASGEINRSHRTVRLFVGEVKKTLQDVKDIEEDPSTQDENPVISDNDDAYDKYRESKEEEEQVELVELDVEETQTCAGEIADDPLEVTPPPEVPVFIGEGYEIFGDEYRMTYSGETHNLWIKLVDKVFLAHSRKGLNLTEQQVLNLLGIKESQFKVIKARLGLNKDAEAYSPYLDQILNPEELLAYISENTTELLQTLSTIEDPIRDSIVREAKKQLVLLQNKNLLFKKLIDKLHSEVGTISVRPLEGKVETQPGKEITVVISDLHIGVKTPLYNVDIAEQKLKEVQYHLNGLNPNGERDVNVIIPGDIVHNISGVMHPNSWKGTEEGMWGANALIKPFELILNFLVGIAGLKSVYIIGGNHDRLNADKNLENTAEGAKLIAYMLNSMITDVPVLFDSQILKYNSGKLRFIAQHGDLNADKKKNVDAVVWEHGESDKFNIVITGHHHSRIIQRGDDTYMAMRISVPAFCPQDDYAKHSGYTNNPGFLIFQEKQGRPAILDIPIVYELPE